MKRHDIPPLTKGSLAKGPPSAPAAPGSLILLPLQIAKYQSGLLILPFTKNLDKKVILILGN
jgi:hypothetical protein